MNGTPEQMARWFGCASAHVSSDNKKGGKGVSYHLIGLAYQFGSRALSR